MLRCLIFLLISPAILGCSHQDTNTSKTLSLSLVNRNNTFAITDYTVSDNPYKDARQQGLYQVHLIDKEDRILQKIGFERLEIPSSKTESGEADFFVSIPLVPNLDRIIFYQLDGSSGHYVLKDDDPLLKWTLPDDLKEKRKE